MPAPTVLPFTHCPRCPILLCSLLLLCTSTHAQVVGPPETAFNRIIHGWTNYSTAFNATHDTGAAADYATLATPYTPNSDAQPLEYGVIVIGSEARPPDFSRFQFRVAIWSSLNAFIQEPRSGDVATWNFAMPTGGSISVPDTTTRGGRPAYELRFNLTNSPIALSDGRPYLIGFAARADTQTAGELFVPTSSHAGPSDVQAGDLIVGGWRYVVSAGGSTVYSGQLATALIVLPQSELPRLEITRTPGFVRLSWPASAKEFALEFALTLTPESSWYPVDAEPFEEDGQLQVVLPATFDRQWFRLRR